jgi:hypothetical protein
MSDGNTCWPRSRGGAEQCAMNHATAADLSLLASEVQTYNPWMEELRPVFDRGGIKLIGGDREDYAEIALVTTVIDEAHGGAHIIVDIVPSTAHEFHAELLAAHTGSCYLPGSWSYRRGSHLMRTLVWRGRPARSVLVRLRPFRMAVGSRLRRSHVLYVPGPPTIRRVSRQIRARTLPRNEGDLPGSRPQGQYPGYSFHEQ